MTPNYLLGFIRCGILSLKHRIIICLPCLQRLHLYYCVIRIILSLDFMFGGRLGNSSASLLKPTNLQAPTVLKKRFYNISSMSVCKYMGYTTVLEKLWHSERFVAY